MDSNNIDNKLIDSEKEYIEKIAHEFIKYIVNNSTDIEPEFNKILSDNFWELLA